MAFFESYDIPALYSTSGDGYPGGRYGFSLIKLFK